MMYSINGVPLDNPTRGWWMDADSKPLNLISWERESYKRQGRDGVLGGVAAIVGAPSIPLVVECKRTSLEDLTALFGSVGMLSLTASPSREIAYEMHAVTPEGVSTADADLRVTFTLRFPGVFWRSKTATTTSAALAAASVVVQPFPGLSAAVQDAVVRVKGAAGGLQVTDASGAWLSFATIPSGQWLRVEGRRAFLTTTDTWTGGTDVSGQLSQGGPRRRFEITPVIAAGDPSSRSGRLTVTTASRSGAVIEVRGKSAHTQAER